MLASKDGKIVCENTLDARLDVVFRKKLPEVHFFYIFYPHSSSLEFLGASIMSSKWNMT